MVKLNDRKIRWIIQEKLRERGAGEIALIQQVTHRRIEQIWQSYRRTSVAPTLKQPSKTKGEPTRLHDAALILKAYDELKVNALTLERALRDVYRVRIPHNRIQDGLNNPVSLRSVRIFRKHLGRPECSENTSYKSDSSASGSRTP